jgi:hypothetical protein
MFINMLLQCLYLIGYFARAAELLAFGNYTPAFAKGIG